MDDDRAVVGVGDAYLEEPPGVVGPDEHGESFVQILGSDGMVESVEDVVVATAVLASALGDQRLQSEKLPWTRSVAR